MRVKQLLHRRASDYIYAHIYRGHVRGDCVRAERQECIKCMLYVWACVNLNKVSAAHIPTKITMKNIAPLYIYGWSSWCPKSLVVRAVCAAYIIRCGLSTTRPTRRAFCAIAYRAARVGSYGTSQFAISHTARGTRYRRAFAFARADSA